MDNNENNNGFAAIAGHAACGYQVSEEDCAKLQVLNMEVMDLKYVYHELHEIYKYLSIHDTLEEFVCGCGTTMNEWSVYDAIIKNQPTTLPAKAFLQSYFRDNNTTLRQFIDILLRMKPKHYKIQELVKSLWNVALYQNSQYFRNMCEHSNNN